MDSDKKSASRQSYLHIYEYLKGGYLNALQLALAYCLNLKSAIGYAENN